MHDIALTRGVTVRVQRNEWRGASEELNMARRPLRPCAHPGCSQLVRHHSRCGEHARAQRQVRQQARDDRFYSTKPWRRCRRLFLAANPLCVDCEREGRVTLAVDVHHTVPRRECADPYDWAVLEGLCKSCHSKRRN